ncbi:MAG: VanZ family protein [Aeoliella sp.]
MTLFTSNRERRLWAWTLAIVVAIYSTLSLAPTLARALRDSGLIEEAVLLSMLLIVATILTLGLKARPGGAEIGVALGVTAVYLLLFLRMTASPAERTHLMEYGVVAVFVYEALTERASQGRRVPVPALLAALATSLLGVLDECIQAFLPSRVFDPIDILFNVLAAVMSVVAMVVLSWARRLTIRARRRDK